MTFTTRLCVFAALCLAAVIAWQWSATLDTSRDATQLALQQFGLMARTVFRLWGIEQTVDFGEIVFNLVEAKLMFKTDDDSLNDFRDVFDLDQALVQSYQIQLGEAE